MPRCTADASADPERYVWFSVDREQAVLILDLDGVFSALVSHPDE